MTDIVERLRKAAVVTMKRHHTDATLHQEAADEIERLREENADMALGPTMVQNQRAEIERLRAELLDTQERLRIQRDLTDITAEQVRDVRVPARDAALEEAAKAVEAQPIRFADRVTVAAAVRALKDKP